MKKSSEQTEFVQALLRGGLGEALNLVFAKDTEFCYKELVTHFVKFSTLAGADPRLAVKANKMMELLVGILEQEAETLGVVCGSGAGG